MLKFLFIAIFSCSLWANQLTKEQFMVQVRQNLLQHSWLKVSGDIFFRPNDGDVIRQDIEIRAQMNFEKITFQIEIDQKEKVSLYQKFANIYESKELFNNLKEKNSFLMMGLNIADLSLSFMYWDLIKELDGKRIGLHRCRVFLMRNPDDINFAKIYISEKYLAPLRVDWFIDLQKEPYQKLEFKSFTEKNSIWAPKKIKLVNAKGRISIQGKTLEAGKGSSSANFFTK